MNNLIKPTKYYRCTTSGIHYDNIDRTFLPKVFIASYDFDCTHVIKHLETEFKNFSEFKVHIVDEILSNDFNNKKEYTLPIKQFIFEIWK